MEKTPQPEIGIASSDIDLTTVPLADIPALVWTLLATGVRHSSHAFHTPSIATFGEHGPSQRTVVLRHVDAKQRLIVCHTDRRSNKVQELAHDSGMSWHFYARELKLQVIVRGQATVHTDTPFSDDCWERSTMRGRTCYNTPLAPGIPVALPPTAPPAIDGHTAAAAARSHFAAIACQVDQIEWLYLCADGHRRAGIGFDGGETSISWLTP